MPYNQSMGEPVTVVEMPSFQKEATRLLSVEEQKALIDHLALYPLDGDLIQRSGGFRKLRWARGGSGKSGGVRVIYYFYNEAYPLFLTYVYPKGEKENLSRAEVNELNKLSSLIIETYGE